MQALSISRSLVNARTSVLNGNNHGQQIKDQIVQTLTEAGGQVDYVEVMFLAFPWLLNLSVFLDLLSFSQLSYLQFIMVVVVVLIVLQYNYSGCVGVPTRGPGCQLVNAACFLVPDDDAIDNTVTHDLSWFWPRGRKSSKGGVRGHCIILHPMCL